MHNYHSSLVRVKNFFLYFLIFLVNAATLSFVFLFRVEFKKIKGKRLFQVVVLQMQITGK